MKQIARILALALLALTAAATASEAQPVYSFKVVVHPSNPISELAHAELSRLFLKKSTLWAHSGGIVPVDLAPDHPVRQRFSQEIHGREVRRIQNYWQRLIFSGRATPPLELDRESQVLEFVANNRQAIGYVSSTTPVGKDVKVVKVVEFVEEDN